MKTWLGNKRVSEKTGQVYGVVKPKDGWGYFFEYDVNPQACFNPSSKYFLTEEQCKVSVELEGK